MNVNFSKIGAKSDSIYIKNFTNKFESMVEAHRFKNNCLSLNSDFFNKFPQVERHTDPLSQQNFDFSERIIRFCNRNKKQRFSNQQVYDEKLSVAMFQAFDKMQKSGKLGNDTKVLHLIFENSRSPVEQTILSSIFKKTKKPYKVPDIEKINLIKDIILNDKVKDATDIDFILGKCKTLDGNNKNILKAAKELLECKNIDTVQDIDSFLQESIEYSNKSTNKINHQKLRFAKRLLNNPKTRYTSEANNLFAEYRNSDFNPHMKNAIKQILNSDKINNSHECYILLNQCKINYNTDMRLVNLSIDMLGQNRVTKYTQLFPPLKEMKTHLANNNKEGFLEVVTRVANNHISKNAGNQPQKTQISKELLSADGTTIKESTKTKTKTIEDTPQNTSKKNKTTTKSKSKPEDPIFEKAKRLMGGSEEDKKYYTFNENFKFTKLYREISLN